MNTYISLTADPLSLLLVGSLTCMSNRETPHRLSDTALVKLFRLLSLARRFADIESGNRWRGCPERVMSHVRSASSQLRRHRTGTSRSAQWSVTARQVDGFDDEDLDALKHPAMASILTSASVSWCNVVVNREVLCRLLHQVDDVNGEIARINRLLRLGVSTELISRFFGLTHQKIALRRSVIGLPKQRNNVRAAIPY